jgi:hypothetical protein
MDSLASLVRAFPDLPPSEIVCLNNQATGRSSHNHKKKKMTTSGPSRCQALLTFAPDTGVGASLKPDECTCLINQHLVEAKVTLCVKSTSIAYGGWSLATTSVPSDNKLVLLAQAVGTWVMPQFTRQVNIVRPQSRSYLSILDIPRWYTTGVETTIAQVEAVLQASPLRHLFQLTGPIRPVNNSPSSNTKTVYLKVWDSKAGSAVKELIGRAVQFGKYACHIVKGKAVPGTPLCMRCWRWGHPFKIYRAQVVCCPLCSENHHEEHHRSMGSCCILLCHMQGKEGVLQWFFNARIEEVSETNMRPWDLMEWVKQRKLLACEAIQYQGQSCHTLESLWDTLHGTYNAASGWQADLTALDDLDPLPERDWVGFSSCEMFDVLSACSSRSAPGLDHVTWTHLKRILPDSIVS